MKKYILLLSLLALTLCGCSPKIASNASGTAPASHPDYAVIYFYRPGNFVQTPYDVHLNDQVVYRSKNNTKTFVKVDKPGKYEIWGSTESRESINVDIEMGKDYYVKSYVKFGVAIWRPAFDLMAPEFGRNEWNATKKLK